MKQVDDDWHIVWEEVVMSLGPIADQLKSTQVRAHISSFLIESQMHNGHCFQLPQWGITNGRRLAIAKPSIEKYCNSGPHRQLYRLLRAAVSKQVISFVE